MCTLSVILSRDDVVRIAMNRDELDGRTEALAPRAVSTGSITALMPIDPQSGGTWIAASEAGLVLAMLNVNLRNGPTEQGTISRGRIIPMLLEAGSAAEAIDAASELDPSEFAPFRLVAIDRSTVASLRYDGSSTMTDSALIDTPVMFTSSGLGDALVEAPRRALFEQMMWAIESPASAQDAFHRHRWANRPHLSVNMIRPGARTVSRTVVEIEDDRLRMFYQPIRAREATTVHASLEIREAVRA
jgi:uncharacterized protein with NRDE domain